ncbi:hypothetical protein ACFE04_027594 [Oxalis oulophora]
MAQLIEELKAKAESYLGDELGRVKSKEFLAEVGLPNGLLPLHDIIECGYERESGYVWLKQKEQITHKFEKIDREVIYETEVTAYVEQNKILKLEGVKAKELLVWVPVNEIIHTPETSEITFKSYLGISRSFPSDAFIAAEKLISMNGNLGIGGSNGEDKILEKEILQDLEIKIPPKCSNRSLETILELYLDDRLPDKKISSTVSFDVTL